EERVITLVTHLRADVLNDRISKDSPLGQALMGHRVGDRVTVRINETSSYTVEIRDLEKGEDDRTSSVN
ncbi:MAG: GreA/GreB family elongation factor, partial [Clostridia bacterium]|nr:GreA/GreB family elongation factor [Clostridia bacterium]